MYFAEQIPPGLKIEFVTEDVDAVPRTEVGTHGFVEPELIAVIGRPRLRAEAEEQPVEPRRRDQPHPAVDQRAPRFRIRQRHNTALPRPALTIHDEPLGCVRGQLALPCHVLAMHRIVVTPRALARRCERPSIVKHSDVQRTPRVLRHGQEPAPARSRPMTAIVMR